jgi:cytochrome c oxidase assembly protein subunit 15
MIERWRRILFAWFAVLTALAWMLIVLGALVRAHGAGLSCPDWPLCFGQLVPTFDAKVAFEWGHRVFAGSLSLGLVTGAVLTWRQGGELWARAKRPIVAAGLLFVVQAILGGLTVLHLLASWTVTSHLLCGNAFAATLLWSALSFRDGHAVERSPRVLAATVFAAAALLLQMALGGLTSSQYAGLACPEWPACSDGVWFPELQGLVGLQLLHRWNAMGVLVAYVALFLATRRHPLSRLTAGLLALVVTQIGLGVANVLLRLPVEVTALHSACAAALFLLTTATIHRQVATRAGVVSESLRSRSPALPLTDALPLPPG